MIKRYPFIGILYDSGDWIGEILSIYFINAVDEPTAEYLIRCHIDRENKDRLDGTKLSVKKLDTDTIRVLEIA